MKREPVVIVMSVLAALQFLFGGWAGVQALNGNPLLASIGAVGVLAVAAAQVGLQFYVRGQVTPVQDAEVAPLLRDVSGPEGGGLGNY